MDYYIVIPIHGMQIIDDNISKVSYKNRPASAYHTEQAAREAANKLAMKEPTTQVAIFKAVSTVETKIPTFVEKVFTPTGELIPR